MVHYLNIALAVLAMLSCMLMVWQWIAARQFPLHQKTDARDFVPSISLLKSLKGCDETTEMSLRTWFQQNYAGEVEILFGVADANDPVCRVVRRLMAEYPDRRAQLIICGPLAGANAKVAKLAQLEKMAAHDLILISDADVRVPPDFLASFVTPLREKKVGLVNCFYRLANPTTRAMQWEAVAVNADFWSQVLQSRSLKPLDFALGAAILMRRSVLAEMGGFAVLANCLADDYQLGRRIAAHGHEIALCPVVVECWDAPQNWSQVWKHQLRWARTIRICQPVPYFFSILSNASIWPILWLPAAAADGGFLSVLLAVAVLLLLRMGLARALQQVFAAEETKVTPIWMAFVKDMLQAAIWFTAFLGGTIEWRGRRMKVQWDGTLVEI